MEMRGLICAAHLSVGANPKPLPKIMQLAALGGTPRMRRVKKANPQAWTWGLEKFPLGVDECLSLPLSVWTTQAEVLPLPYKI